MYTKQDNIDTFLDGEMALPNDRELPRTCAFIVLIMIWVGLLWHRLSALGELAVRSDPYSHTVLIPFLSAAFIYWRRKMIFVGQSFSVGFAVPFYLAGACLYAFSLSQQAKSGISNGLTTSIFSLVLLLVGSFALCYGSRAVREASFALIFLLLMVPIPNVAVEAIIRTLQHTSAAGSAILFNLLGIPVHRENDLLFDLPGVRILVADECSGIRSTIALFITVLLAAQLSLRTNWRKLILCLLVAPIAIAKNSIRIVTLSSLAVYVNPDFLQGRLHHDGGVIFFLLGLVMLLGLLRALERWERIS